MAATLYGITPEQAHAARDLELLVRAACRWGALTIERDGSGYVATLVSLTGRASPIWKDMFRGHGACAADAIAVVLDALAAKRAGDRARRKGGGA